MDSRTLLTILFCFLLAEISAQEFWMQPDKFLHAPGEKLTVVFKAGENFIGKPWLITNNQIENLSVNQVSSTINLKDSVVEGEKNNISYVARLSGTYMLSLQTNNTLSELSADQFNEYLKNYGLEEVLDQRKKSNSLSSPGREYFSVQSKLLFQVGDKTDDTYKKILGFTAEIIPDRNPNTLRVGDQIRFKILFDGKPVFGVRVKLWSRFNNRTTIQNIYTEKDGTFEARISNPGPWMVTVIKITPSKLSGAEWQSHRASLIFGIQK